MEKFASILACLIVSVTLAAQEKKTPEQMEKEFYESIENQVERLSEQLDLEDWQTFYVDSILTHDYTAMREELSELSKAKVSNSDIFYSVQDKWMEQIYNSFHAIFDENQWAKYLKNGAARDKRARDKRAAKTKK